MLCPNCNSSQVFVIDSRLSGNTTRRRRRCADCNVRFSTLEVIEYEYKNLKGKELLLRDMLRKATEVQ